MSKIALFSIFVLIIGVLACESGITDGQVDLDDENGQVFNCSKFSYADSIFFINSLTDNKIRPLENLAGRFTAFPEGLKIDTLTGEIDINKSETGLRYRISFRPVSSPNTTCEFSLIIGGVNYLDKVYVINQNDFLAKPIFNGVLSGLSPCDDDDDDDDNDFDDDDECKFDEDGPSGLKLADLGVEINKNTGVIDLKKTLENKAFGENPANGSTIEAKLYYRLQDRSLGALNGINLKIFYFRTLNDVPQSLLNQIEEKRSGIMEQIEGVSFENARLRTDNPNVKPRPPFLIIVASIE